MIPQPEVEKQNGRWLVLDNYHLTLGRQQILVEAGFECDGASIPRIISKVVPEFREDSLGTAGPLVHDWLYSRDLCTREEADRIFMAVMLLDGVPINIATTAFAAVREFAGFAWKGVKKMNFTVLLPILKELAVALVSNPLVNKTLDHWTENNSIDPKNEWDVKVWHMVERLAGVDPEHRTELAKKELDMIQAIYTTAKTEFNV